MMAFVGVNKQDLYKHEPLGKLGKVRIPKSSDCPAGLIGLFELQKYKEPPVATMSQGTLEFVIQRFVTDVLGT